MDATGIALLVAVTIALIEGLKGFFKLESRIAALIGLVYVALIVIGEVYFAEVANYLLLIGQIWLAAMGVYEFGVRTGLVKKIT